MRILKVQRLTGYIKMNKQKIEAAITILTDVLEGRSTPSSGICGALFDLPMVQHLPDYFKGWMYFSGNYHFPVPHCGGVYKFWCCNTYDDFWSEDHQYGRLRRHLAQHIINCLKQELEELQK